MKGALVGTLLAVAVVLQSCSTQVYNNRGYLKQTDINGKKVAILPVEVELTGRLPKNMTESGKTKLENDESRLIQQQLFGQYLYKSKKGKKRKAIDLINVDRVNSTLSEKGIDARQAWAMDPDSLGRLLGADLVLKVRVKKDRIMSETASLGIGVAGAVLDNIFSKSDNVNTTPTNTAKTYNLFLDATLTDVKSHAVVTKFSHKGDANWNRRPEEVIESSGRKIVRKGVVYASN
ncbi:hypothetical protein [Desertivirga arenae]|uniref:hypothetical protein n=1 Tax=Desertivirga arenae TaxID=2810309 RepID=UPI001A97308C|nr:hypothetical protein [Pedobacter sp. SYSU D00823]